MAINEKAAPVAGRAASGRTFDDVIIAEIPKNSREVYRITRRDFKGYPLVDVRIWFDDATTDELRPGKGVSIKLEALPEIVAALSGLIEGGRL
ncbi:MAG: transcriptional coactivator p15/PC4 family protein [Candidatus Accumulibacter sp.]|uniref:Transcriptional coactivator p15/PC4 family protein n=1 Tax=Candidatus Accumulibacter proximus TaxID=2954385 RepID=A0A935PYF8_9PROT|nr:transcriptional coactivator p15/PC4 family protein [Candidatus Accumulibacter proximus]